MDPVAAPTLRSELESCFTSNEEERGDDEEQEEAGEKASKDMNLESKVTGGSSLLEHEQSSKSTGTSIGGLWLPPFTNITNQLQEISRTGCFRRKWLKTRMAPGLALHTLFAFCPLFIMPLQFRRDRRAT